MLGHRATHSQRVHEVQHVDHRKDDRKANTHPLDRCAVHRCGAQGEKPGDEQQHHRERYHCGANAGQVRIELLEPVTKPSNQ